MLDKSIKMNLKLCEKHMGACIGWLIVSFLCITDVFTIVGWAGTFLCIMLIYRDLFDRSLFSEEAYTYMAVPISMKDMVLGKVIAVSFCSMIGFAVVCVTSLVSGLISDAGSPDMSLESIGGHLLQLSSGLYSGSIDDSVVLAEEIVYERGELLGIAAAIITVPFQILAVNLLCCGVFQMGFIVRHLVDPQRNSGLTAVVAIFGSLAVVFLILAVATSIAYGISIGIEHVFRPLMWLIIPLGCGIGFITGSIKILTKKYSID